MSTVLWLALAGAAGTLARWGLQVLVSSLRPGFFPWGTLSVNALGCVAFGLVWSLSEERLLVPTHLRLVVLTGFLGAFTTWSSYVFESGEMLRTGRWGLAAAYIAAQHLCGFAGFFGGLALGRKA